MKTWSDSIRSILRCLIISLIFLGCVTPAYACRTWQLFETIFFDKVPPDFYLESDFHSDVVAEVVLDDVRSEGIYSIVNARVKNVIKGNIKVGERIQLQYNVTSCGPFHKKGEEGMIAARYGNDKNIRNILVALTPPRGGYPDYSKTLFLKAAPSNGEAPLTVHFSAPAAPEEGTYSIDFGDGQKSDLQKQCKGAVCTVDASHTYVLRGTYAGVLTLTPACNTGICAAIRTGSAGVTVRGGQEPWASLSATPSLAKEPPLEVTFMIKGFGGPFTLEYGDGFSKGFGYILDGRTITATHIYKNPGTFKAKLVSLSHEYETVTITVGKRILSAACRDAIQKFWDGKIALPALRPVCGDGDIPLFEP